MSDRPPVTPRRRGLALLGVCFAAAVMSCGRMGCQSPTQAPVALVGDTRGVVEPRRVMFDPNDGERLMIVEANNIVAVWDVANLNRISRAMAFATAASDAQFAQNGWAIVTAGRDGAVRWWNGDGTERWSQTINFYAAFRAVAVTKDDALVAAGGDDTIIRLWDDSGALRQTLEGSGGMILSLAFSPKGDLLVSESADTLVRFWRKGADGRFAPAGTLRAPNETYIQLMPSLIRLDVQWGWGRSVVFSPDGKLLLTANFDGTAQLWDVETMKPRTEPFTDHDGQHVRAVAFSPRGDLVATGGYDGTARLWTLDGKPVGEPLKGHQLVLTSLDFSPDGERIATTGVDNTVRLWSVKGALLGTFPRSPAAPPLPGQ